MSKAPSKTTSVSTSCPACYSTNIREIHCFEGHPILRCEACRLDFVSDNDVAQKGTSKYESSATPLELVANYYRTIEQDVAAARKSIRLRIPIFEAAFGGKLSSVCEIGCSTGTGFRGFLEQDIQWLGLETDPQWIELGRLRGVPILNADLSDLDQRFDLIYFHQVLEHIWEPATFMKVVYDHLNPGGLVHVAVPNHAGFTALTRRSFPCFFPREYGMIQIPHHLRAYSPFTLRKLFQRAGFIPIEVRGICHTDLCWGEWFHYRGTVLNRMIFKTGGILGLGTLLFGYAKKPGN